MSCEASAGGRAPARGDCVKIEVHPDDGLVARKGAAVIAGDARAAVAARGRFIVAVSGGRTPWLMLRALANEQLPWENVHIVQVDERVAPAGDPDRNLTHLRASLLDHAPLPADHIHAMPVEAPDLARAAAQYAATLQDLAGLPPVLDLGSSRPWTGRPHRIAGARRSGARRHRRRRRGDTGLPRPAPDDVDVSDHQPVPARPMAGDRP